MAYWLVKSEPSVYSIDDFKRDGATIWHGVRNYQARNNLRAMKQGEEVIFYHSIDDPHGVAGIAQVKKEASPDPTQFDKKSEYFDEKSTKENPRWWAPDLKFVRKFSRVISLKELKEIPALKNMVLLTKGSRLSVQPVTDSEYKAIVRVADSK